MTAEGLPPTIAIDGPSASGKGTVAQRVALQLGFHYLDSGALYRLVALAAIDAGVALDDEAGLGRTAATLEASFSGVDITLNHKLVTDAIRTEAVSAAASRIAALAPVRSALLARQRAFRQMPGLVADGRDMGTVVFPDAVLKIYLTADAETRALRRYKQLIGKGMNANMATLLQDIRSRDERDRGRSVAPLQKSDESIPLDTTQLDIDAAVEQVLMHYFAATKA